MPRGCPTYKSGTSLGLYLSLRHGVRCALADVLHEDRASHSCARGQLHPHVPYPERDANHDRLELGERGEGNLVEAKDGPPHAAELDRCDDQDDLRLRKHQLATSAATEHVARDTGNHATRLRKRWRPWSAILDKYIGYSPGCTFDNGWCQAPEHAYGNGSTLGCDVRPPGRERPRGCRSSWLHIAVLAQAAGARERARGSPCSSSASSRLRRLAQTQGPVDEPVAPDAPWHPPTPVKEPGP